MWEGSDESKSESKGVQCACDGSKSYRGYKGERMYECESSVRGCDRV